MVSVHGQLTLLFLGLWEDRNLEAVLFTFWWPGSDEGTEGEGVCVPSEQPPAYTDAATRANESIKESLHCVGQSPRI